MNIKPLADRVLVLPAPAEEKIGGIIIPDTAKEKHVSSDLAYKEKKCLVKSGKVTNIGC